ncbi:uncharacterized protein BJX67DRAFT_377945 [Aspergillus lucknowensis]|uniref:Uncharacterized protein n=1 Tax=Aspergillus lucknowensis TaxID=176173 RepID=A0ABR4M1A7_9EURO
MPPPAAQAAGGGGKPPGDRGDGGRRNPPPDKPVVPSGKRKRQERCEVCGKTDHTTDEHDRLSNLRTIRRGLDLLIGVEQRVSGKGKGGQRPQSHRNAAPARQQPGGGQRGRRPRRRVPIVERRQQRRDTQQQPQQGQDQQLAVQPQPQPQAEGVALALRPAPHPEPQVHGQGGSDTQGPPQQAAPPLPQAELTEEQRQQLAEMNREEFPPLPEDSDHDIDMGE